MGVGILNNYKQVVKTIGETAPAPVAPAPTPSPEGDFGVQLGPKVKLSKDEFKLRYNKPWVEQLVEKHMERHASAEDYQQARRAIAPVLKQHGTLEAAKKAVVEHFKKTTEYKLRHAEQWVDPLYKKALGREAKGKDQAWIDKQVAPVIRKDGTVAEAKQRIASALKKTGEYKRKHPTINRNRGEIYRTQPNGWTCGPTSLTMALKALGLRGKSDSVLNEMVRRTGANPSYGVPGNASLIANAAKQVGAQATYSASGSPGAVREALKKGHGVVLNGSLGTGGHFIYVAGLDKDGRFIICDPARPEITRMNDSELNHFANTYGNPRGFAEIWR